MRFKTFLFILPFLFFSSCRQPEIPPLKREFVYVVDYYFSAEFVKLLDDRFALLYETFNYQYLIEVFRYGYFQLSSEETGPVWDAAVFFNSIFIQFRDTAAIGYYDISADTFRLEYLPVNPGYTGVYKRDNLSIYGIRNDSVFIFYPDSLREELFTVLPFSTRHITVSPDGRYVGSPDGKIYDTQRDRVVGDFSSLGWDFSFYDDSTLIFGDTLGGYAIKWLKITDKRVTKAVPVTNLWVSKPVRIGNEIYFVSTAPDLRCYRNYQYHVCGNLMKYIVEF